MKIVLVSISIIILLIVLIYFSQRVHEEKTLITKRFETPSDEDVEFVGEVIDLIWALPWPEESASEEYVEFFKNLKPEYKVIWSTWLVQNHVSDWGFGQYYLNIDHPVFIEEAEKGFKELGADGISKIFESVINYYEKHLPEIENCKSQEEFDKIMGTTVLDKELGNVHDRFFSQKANLYKLRTAYIRKNEAVFNGLKNTK